MFAISKDWKYISGDANAENVEVLFLKVGNYSVELAVTYTYDVVLKNGETEIEEDEVAFEQESIVTAANNLDELTQIHADSNFLKLVKKASDYKVKPEYVNDPTPSIFLAKGYYGIYRNELPDPIVTDPWEETINSIAEAIELDLNGILNEKIHKIWLDKFQNDFSNSFLNYDNFNDRHSPLLIMIISFLNIKGIHIDLIRFIHLNLLPLLVIVSYKCLTLKFNKNNKNIIFLICCVFWHIAFFFVFL